MAKLKQARQKLLDRLDTLVGSISDPTDTIIASDTLETLQDQVGEDQIDPSPQFHYRNQRGEFSIWSGQHWSSGGVNTIDNYLRSIRNKVYYHNSWADGADARYYGYYAGSFRHSQGGNRNWWSTVNNRGSSADCYINGTTATSDLGHHRIVTGYRAVENGCSDVLNAARIAEAIKCTNADVDDADTYITYDAATIKHKYRHISPASPSLSEYPVANNGDSSYGSLSYNKGRQELVLQNRDVSDPTYNFRMSLYSNVPRINRDTKLSTVLSESNRTQHLYTMTTAYSSNDLETFENNKIVLTDDGTVFIVTMSPSGGNLYVDKLVRTAGPVFTFNAITTQTLYTTAYGKQQDSSHGLRIIQSRNRRNVLCFCAYAYYACGIVSFVIDKTRNQHQIGFYTNWTDQGVIPGPYGNQDFVACRSRDWDNPANNSIIALIQKQDGTFVSTDIAGHLDHHPMGTTHPTLIPIIP